VDFMRFILSNTNNFPTPTPVTRKDFLKSMLGKSKTPTPSSSSSSGGLLFG